MGQGGSSVQDVKLQALVKKLNKMELQDIEAVFMELSTKTCDGKSVIYQPTWLNRDKFAEVLGTNEFIIEQLFEAFDRDQDGIIDLQEFVSGMALCLHGSINKKCHLLFKIFNLDGDDGIDRKELSLVLTNCLQSAHALLRKTSITQGIMTEEDHIGGQMEGALITSALVDKIVKDAFDKCDVSHTGKLNIDEFANWVHRNPKLVNNIFVMQCPKPSQDQGKSNPSFNFTQYKDNSRLEKPVVSDTSEKDAVQAEDDSESNEPTQTILKMASVKGKSTKLQELFPDESETDNFFDCIGNDASEGNKQFYDVRENESVRRSQSEIFTQKHFVTSSEGHSGSQVDINLIPEEILHPSPRHLLGTQSNSESLYSIITLSQESLCEDKEFAMDLPYDASGVNTTEQESDIVASDSLVEDTGHDHWHPLRSAKPATNTLLEEVKEVCPANIEEGFTDEIGEDCLAEAMEDNLKLGTPGALLGESLKSICDTSEKQVGAFFWQPNEQTLQLLQMAAEGNAISEQHLTKPVVLVDAAMTDPVTELVEKYLGEQEAFKRPTPNINQVELTEQGLNKLLENGCWRAAIDFTARYWTTHCLRIASPPTKEEPILTPKIIQIWFTRIALLTRLRMFSNAEAELNAFGDFDAPDLYYQFYPYLYPGQKGSMVPFSFRLLHAEIPQHNGRSKVTLDRLYSLLAKVKIIHNNLSKGLTEIGEKQEKTVEKDTQERLKIWEKRKTKIHYAIVNCFLGMKDYILAVKLLEQIIVMEPSRETAVLSAIGRVYLQLGDCRTANKYFKRIGQVPANDVKRSSMVTMNMGYLSLAKGLYEDSYQHFLSAINLDQDNLAACNNAAVCLLFMGKVKEASDILETMVCRSPEKSLHEEILLNLTTVYELETSRALQKKHKLLDLVCKHKGDGFNVQCLKLT